MIRKLYRLFILNDLSCLIYPLFCGDGSDGSSLAKSDICYNTAEWENGWDAIIENSCWAKDWDPDRWGDEGWSIDN